MSSLELKAQNIKCGGCAANIQKGLTALDGIDTVEVNVATGGVHIEGNTLDQTRITAKLAELGYPVVQD